MDEIQGIRVSTHRSQCQLSPGVRDKLHWAEEKGEGLWEEGHPMGHMKKVSRSWRIKVFLMPWATFSRILFPKIF